MEKIKQENLILEQEIKNNLKKVGVPVHLLGYKYLVTAILFYIQNENVTMADIYKEINKRHNVKKTKAERDIRYILQTYTIDFALNKITNKSFIIYFSEEILEKLKKGRLNNGGE